MNYISNDFILNLLFAIKDISYINMFLIIDKSNVEIIQYFSTFFISLNLRKKFRILATLSLPQPTRGLIDKARVFS